MKSHGTHLRCRTIPDVGTAEVFGRPRDIFQFAVKARALMTADRVSGWEEIPRLALGLAARFVIAEYSLQSGLLAVTSGDQQASVPLGLLIHDSQGWQGNASLCLESEGWMVRGAWDIGPHAAHVLVGCALMAEHRDDDVGGPDLWLVWSHKNQCWWAPRQQGYTSKITRAGQFTRAEAMAICALPHDPVHGGLPHAMMVPMPAPEGMRHLYQAELIQQAVDDQIRAAQAAVAGQDHTR